MWENIIGKHIRRTNRNLFLAACEALCVVAILIVPYLRYWRNFLSGPIDASPEMLSKVQEPERLDQYYVRLNGSRAIDTGLQDVEQEVDHHLHGRPGLSNAVTKETLQANYFAVRVGQQFLLVKSPTAAASQEYTGALVNIPEDTRDRLAEELQKDKREFSDVFLPFMLDATDFTSWGDGALVAVAL